MIEHELAKELKDNGFPQVTKPKIVNFRDTRAKGLDDVLRIDYDLSELIEACGEELTLIKGGDYYAYDSAHIEGEFGDFDNEGEGKTPEEAVARLWLALNKHD